MTIPCDIHAIICYVYQKHCWYGDITLKLRMRLHSKSRIVLHFTTQAFNRFYLKYIKPDILYLDICGSFFFFYFDINVLRKSQLEKWNFWNNLSAHFPETRDLESVNALMPDTKSVVKSDEHRYRLRYI